ncbi:MAG: hypothetical protein RLZZ573_119, partial [Pseudomonadota bacterium]
PEDANAEFVCAMEEVLEVYHRPYDPMYPVVCMDELNIPVHTVPLIPVDTVPVIPADAVPPCRVGCCHSGGCCTTL